jgi:hypothetical protein
MRVDPNGAQSEPVSEIDTTDPFSFESYDDYRAANPSQPEQVVREVWYEAKGKKYLIIYDKSNDEFKRQARQAAKDHATTAQSVKPARVSDLIKKTRPDVIMSFGHGIKKEMSMGDGEWVGLRTVRRELKEAGQKQPMRFVAQACSCGTSGGLMDKLSAELDLKNYTFVSHIDQGHVTRNSDIRVAGGKNLPEILRDKVQGRYVTSKAVARKVVSALLDVTSAKETSAKSEVNTVLREVSVLGAEEFWRLVSSSVDPETDPAVLDLNLTSEARARFATGIKLFRSRLTAALKKEGIKDQP